MFVVNEPYLLPAFFLFAFRQKLGTLCWMDLKKKNQNKKSEGYKLYLFFPGSTYLGGYSPDVSAVALCAPLC